MLKILSVEKCREADADTIANEPIASIDLMERASQKCFEWIEKRFPKEKFRFYVISGTGNNGGDGLAIARMLIDADFKVDTFIVNFNNKLSEDSEINKKRLSEKSKITTINEGEELPTPPSNAIIIDAILGSGINKSPEKWLAKVIKQINFFKNPKIAIDMPSGLFADKSSEDNVILNADITLCIGTLKQALLMPENEKYCGQWHLIDINLRREFIEHCTTKKFYLEQNDIVPMISERNFFSHKGNYGHTLLMSGSKGKMGAAVLATQACLRSGCGLVTTHVPHDCSDIIQIAAPEAMVSIDENPEIISTCPTLDKYTSAGFGPGCGTEKQSAATLKLLIQNSNMPLLIDADGLNILAENKTWLAYLPKGSILTPHIGEFNRLFGKKTNHFERIETASNEAVKNSIIIILKGANTAICTPDGKIFFNSTGNSGMAKGGSGDVLSGLINGLLSRIGNPYFAAIAGVYIHGLAGDIAAEKFGKEAMKAGDIINSLPEAWKTILD